jgi:hypothetical protein
MAAAMRPLVLGLVCLMQWAGPCKRGGVNHHGWQLLQCYVFRVIRATTNSGSRRLLVAVRPHDAARTLKVYLGSNFSVLNDNLIKGLISCVKCISMI